MVKNAVISHHWIPHRTVLAFERTARDEIFHPKEEISYLLEMTLSIAEYFQRPALAASIRLAIEINSSDAY